MPSDGDLYWLEIPKSHREDIEDRWGQLPEGVYPLSTTERPGFLPDAYWQKGRRAVLTVRGTTSSDRTYCGIVLEREDQSHIDQDSIGVVICSSGPHMRAAQLLHGNWGNRTQDLEEWAEKRIIPDPNPSQPLHERRRPWSQFEGTSLKEASEAVHRRARSASTQWGEPSS